MGSNRISFGSFLQGCGKLFRRLSAFFFVPLFTLHQNSAKSVFPETIGAIKIAKIRRDWFLWAAKPEQCRMIVAVSRRNANQTVAVCSLIGKLTLNRIFINLDVCRVQQRGVRIALLLVSWAQMISQNRRAAGAGNQNEFEWPFQRVCRKFKRLEISSIRFSVNSSDW